MSISFGSYCGDGRIDRGAAGLRGLIAMGLRFAVFTTLSEDRRRASKHRLRECRALPFGGSGLTVAPIPSVFEYPRSGGCR